MQQRNITDTYGLLRIDVENIKSGKPRYDEKRAKQLMQRALDVLEDARDRINAQYTEVPSVRLSEMAPVSACIILLRDDMLREPKRLIVTDIAQEWMDNIVACADADDGEGFRIACKKFQLAAYVAVKP